MTSKSPSSIERWRSCIARRQPLRRSRRTFTIGKRPRASTAKPLRARTAPRPPSAARIVCNGVDGSGCFVRCVAGELLDDMAKYAQSQIVLVAEWHETQLQSREHAALDKFANVCSEASEASGGAASVDDLFSLRHVLRSLGQADDLKRVPGSQCDACGATDGLRKCKRCECVWYCSRACQLQAWSDRHKDECRLPGAYKPGDRVALRSEIPTHVLPTNIPVYVIVEAAETQGTGHWLMRPERDSEAEALVMHMAQIQLHPMTFRQPAWTEDKTEACIRAATPMMLANLNDGEATMVAAALRTIMRSHPPQGWM